MVSAGYSHTVLLCSDGRAVACGKNTDGQCNIPPLDEGVSYTQISAGHFHTVLLRSDGSVAACGSNLHGQCNIPPLDEGVSYTQISADHFHTVLLRSDGIVVACGANFLGQCNIPRLDEGVSYTQISAGNDHTVLLRSDGSVVACGRNYEGECNIPPLDAGVSYTQVSAGHYHTVLLRSDGSVLACGANTDGQCNIPPLDAGVSYTQISASYYHTVLLRSDGSVAACGSNLYGQCNIPPLNEGVSYTQISAGHYHTVLLRSDGSVVACGANTDGQCNFPSLKSWRDLLTFASASCRYICDSSFVPQLPIPDCVLQMNLVCEGDAVVMTCLNMAGCEVLRLNARGSDLVSETHQRIARELAAPLRSVRVVLPGGRLLARVSQANPSSTLADVTLGEQFGSWYCKKTSVSQAWFHFLQLPPKHTMWKYVISDKDIFQTQIHPCLYQTCMTGPASTRYKYSSSSWCCWCCRAGKKVFWSTRFLVVASGPQNPCE